MQDRQIIERLTSELEGIIHFADGFACYHSDSPVGLALREYINGARAAVAEVRSESVRVWNDDLQMFVHPHSEFDTAGL